jgi:MFS family permease
MYVLDNILFNFSVAIRTYFQKIGKPEDITSSMALGSTINHIAAVFLPALGGYLWMINYRIPFFVGVGLGVVSLIAAQFMKTHHDKSESLDDVLPPYCVAEAEQL